MREHPTKSQWCIFYIGKVDDETELLTRRLQHFVAGLEDIPNVGERVEAVSRLAGVLELLKKKGSPRTPRRRPGKGQQRN